MTQCQLFMPVAATILLLLIPSSHAFQTMVTPYCGSRCHATPMSRDILRLQAVELESAGAALDEFFRTQPFLSAFVACSMKASAADFLAQTSVDDDNHVAVLTKSSADKVNQALLLLENVNIQRNVAFLLYGGLYQGMFLQFLYMVVYPTLYGGSDLRIPLSIFSDICAFGPFVTLPIAYILRGVIESQTLMDNQEEQQHFSITEPMQQAIEKYKSHVLTQNLLLKYWMIWAPAQTINWCFVPEHLRVFFVAFVSFFWVYLLSAISSQQSVATAADDNVDHKDHHHHTNHFRPRTQSP